MRQYNPSYAESNATNEFYFLDISRHTDENQFTFTHVIHRRNAANNTDDAGLMLDNIYQYKTLNFVQE